MTTANEKLQRELEEKKQAGQHLEQHAVEGPAGEEQPRLETAEIKHFEQQVAQEPVIAEQPQYEVSESGQAGQQPGQSTVERPAGEEEQSLPEVPESEQFEQQVAQGPAPGEQSRHEIPESGKAGQDVEQQTVEVPTAEKPVERKPLKRGRRYEDLHRVVDGVKQKLCRKCEQWKPESDFHKNASSKDGLAVSCKVCKAAAAREYRERRRAAKD